MNSGIDIRNLTIKIFFNFTQHSYNLTEKYFELLQKQNKLTRKFQTYKDRYHQTPDFHNTYNYYKLLYELEYKYRYETKTIAQLFAKKYYFLPVTHYSIFQTDHHRFPTGSLDQQTVKSLDIGLSCGVVDYAFNLYADYSRWKSKNSEGSILSLLGSMIFNSDFRFSCICFGKKKWQHLALAFTILGLNRNKNDDIIYNCYALSLEENKDALSVFICILFYVKAINTRNEFDSPLLTNRTYRISNLTQKYQILNKTLFYASLLSIKHEPQQTWYSYIYLLPIALR